MGIQELFYRIDRRGDLLWRAEGLRGERSNVPREARYFTERGWMKNDTYL